MIKIKYNELIAEMSLKTGKRITINDVATATGISKTTLARISKHCYRNTTMKILNKLCGYFNCSLSELLEHIPNAKTSETVN